MSDLPCPICGKPVRNGNEAAALSLPQDCHPFCSPRCANVDLGRWMTGGYVVPGRDGEALQDDGTGLDQAPALR